MPKYKERRAGDDLRIFKGKYCRDINSGIQEEFDDDEDFDEVGATSKVVSDLEPVDNRSYNEILLEAFEKANEKSSKFQIEALSAICHQLVRHHIPKFLNKNIATIKKIVENSFERNIGAEIKLVGQMVALCFLQLPNEKKFLVKFRPMLIDAFDKQTFTVAVRSSMCKSIAVLIFLHKNNSNVLSNTMSKFEQILTEQTFVRVDYNSVVTGTQIDDVEFLIATLEAWTFLYTLMESDGKVMGDRFARDLVSLLKCSCYDLRIACAKTIAVIYGGSNTEAKDYIGRNLLKIIDDISMIRKDFYPYNYDDKLKSTILFNLRNGTVPRKEIKIGKESLVITTWKLNIQYDLLCNVFGAGNFPQILQANNFLLNLLKDLNPSDNASGRINVGCIPYVNDTDPNESFEETIDNKIEKFKNTIEKSVENFSLNFENELGSLCSDLKIGCSSSNSLLIANKENIFRIFMLIMQRNVEREKEMAIDFATKVVICLGEQNQFSQKICLELMSQKHDPNITTSILSKICTALTFIVLLKNETLHTVLTIMNLMKNIFTGSFPKNRKSIDEETVGMQCNALEGWGIMLTTLPQEDIRSLLDNRGRDSVNRYLDELLQCEQSEIRTVTGELVCLIIEHLRGLYLNLHINSQLPRIIANITKHTRDTTKQIRTQYARSQKVLSYLQNGILPKYHLKVGKERHELHSWSAVLKYKKVCDIWGTEALKSHLTNNDRLLSIISIGTKTLKK